MSDIKQMFHQVKVDPKDINVFCFLWWPDGDLSSQLQDYEILVHLFGVTFLPSCASYALEKTAADNQVEIDVQIIDTLSRKFYVDNCLKSLASLENALKIVTEFSKLLKKGGFYLTKLISNHREIMDVILDKE